MLKLSGSSLRLLCSRVWCRSKHDTQPRTLAHGIQPSEKELALTQTVLIAEAHHRGEQHRSWPDSTQQTREKILPFGKMAYMEWIIRAAIAIGLMGVLVWAITANADRLLDWFASAG